MLTALLTILVFFLFIYLLYLNFSKPRNYPPGPPWLPFVGNSTLIRKCAVELNGQHLAFSKLAEDYNTSILGLKLGSQLVVIVFEPNLVKEVLMSDDFLSRPDNFFIKLRCFGTRKGITFANGSLWHNQRAFVLKTLRDQGMGKPRMENLIVDLVQELIHEIGNNSTSTQNVSEKLSPCILRVLWEVTTGTRLSLKDPRLIQLIEILTVRNQAFDMAGGILGQFPWLRYIAPSWTGFSVLQNLNEKLKAFLQETVAEHKVSFRKGRSRDLIDAFLQEQSSGHEDYSEEQLLMVLVDLFLGGVSSTSTTINFALLLMLKYPDVQEKVFEEINQIIGHDRLPNSSDKLLLPYTEAVLLEVQRLSTVIPVTGPRRALKDLTLHGYFIPKDTTILISQWSVHHNEIVFPDSGKFLPERFLDKTNRSARIQNLIPFGLGKRRCIGENLAKPCIFLIFTGLLQHFKLTSPVSVDELLLDPNPGIILTPKPYKCNFSKRKG